MSGQRPDRAQLTAAAGREVADVIAPGLDVLFCGINPSLYSAALGLHFARPGNRFWPALHGAGFTASRLQPAQQQELLAAGLGITNVVARATARAAELSQAELVAGGRRLEQRLRQYRPRVLAVLGVTAYRTAFAVPKASLGEQAAPLAGCRVWVLPNPSGLNAHYRLAELVELYSQLRLALGRPAQPREQR